LSRIKSLCHSIFIARFKKYKKEAFNADYFSKLKLSPDNKKGSYYRDFFSPDNALDVGCGIGNLVWGFVNFKIAAEGIDISNDAISRSSIEIRPLLKVGDIFNLDYPENKFNLVNCSDTLEHIPEEVSYDIIRSMYRITNRWLVLNICLWTEKNARLDPTHINLHSKMWWTKKIKKLGYTITKTPDDFPSKRNAFIIKKGA
jgi:ubiquinone/menaquinone biosynthesis C-methylase UbiE